MAQDFTRKVNKLTNSDAVVFKAANSDAVIGIRIANIIATAITADVYIDPLDSGNAANYIYIAKTLSIPPNSSVELVQGGAKFVMINTDEMHALVSTADGADMLTSVVQQISGS